MIDKIRAYGDSFLFGSDLKDCDGSVVPSQSTWPALIAKRLGLEYHCEGRGGCGNGLLAQRIFETSDSKTLHIINWTWISRYDHYDQDSVPTWFGVNDDRFEYYKNIQTLRGDQTRSLMNVYASHQLIKQQGGLFISTYMDHSMTQGDNHWPNVDQLISLVNDDLTLFPNNQTFLEWSRANNYPESDNWHPLEQAHEEAAKYWQPIYEKAINTYIT